MYTRFGTGPFGTWFCGPGGPGYFFSGPWGGIVNLIFWILVLYLVFRLLQTMFRKNDPPPSQALEILRHRYANGEITEEEFNHMKTRLQ